MADAPVILDPRALVDYLVVESPAYDLDDLLTMLSRVGRDHGQIGRAHV